MNLDYATKRKIACYSLLSAVLVLGLVQWSFLPLLIQNTELSGGSFLVVSNGHTSKFAAPFKCFLTDASSPVIAEYRLSITRISVKFTNRQDEPSSDWDDHVLSLRQFRSPPSV